MKTTRDTTKYSSVKSAILYTTIGITSISFPMFESVEAATKASLESPQQDSYESGIGLIRGWVCEANKIEVQIDGKGWIPVAYGTPRDDTKGACNDDGNNGFGLTYNWNNAGDGKHTIKARADGIEFGSSQFTVTTLGVEYLRGASGDYSLADFPQKGKVTKVRWSQAHQNFVIYGLTTAGGGDNGAPKAGLWSSSSAIKFCVAADGASLAPVCSSLSASGTQLSMLIGPVTEPKCNGYKWTFATATKVPIAANADFEGMPAFSGKVDFKDGSTMVVIGVFDSSTSSVGVYGTDGTISSQNCEASVYQEWESAWEAAKSGQPATSNLQTSYTVDGFDSETGEYVGTKTVYRN